MPQRLLPLVGQPGLPAGTFAFPWAALDLASTDNQVPDRLW